jgi:two-component system sensor histidine kinase KdpD
VLVASRSGRGPSLAAVVLSIALFDFFFVPPYFTFAVSDLQFLSTFGVMLLISLVISGLTVRVREQANFARERENRTGALYAMSRELSSARDRAHLLEVGGAPSLGKLRGDGTDVPPRRRGTCGPAR